MKTKRTGFEVNDVYRVMENSELIYVLTNSEKLRHEEYKYEQMEMDGLFLSDVLETLTPSRKKVAYAAIELYKRLKEGQVENPAVLSSGNVCKMMHPVLEGLKKQLGERVKIVKIDIDSPVNRQLVNSYQVQAVPTLMLFKAGKMVWRQSGAMQATQIRQVIEKHL